jgi:hypothetical protein
MALVTIEGVTSDLSRKGVITEITVALSGPVDATGADSLVHYHLARGRKNLALRSAVYDPRALTITLKPRGQLSLARTMRLTISGLVDSQGRAIDGNHDGQPGGDAVAILR